MAIYDKIKNIIKESAPLSPQITKTSNLYTDLGFDSLGFMQLLLDIEERFSIAFELMEMESCLQLDRLTALVKSKVEEAGHDPEFINRP